MRRGLFYLRNRLAAIRRASIGVSSKSSLGQPSAKLFNEVASCTQLRKAPTTIGLSVLGSPTSMSRVNLSRLMKLDNPAAQFDFQSVGRNGKLHDVRILSLVRECLTATGLDHDAQSTVPLHSKLVLLPITALIFIKAQIRVAVRFLALIARIIALPMSDGGSIAPAVSRYLQQSFSPRPAPIILPLIGAPARPRNKHRRVAGRCDRGQRSRRAVLQQSKVMGSAEHPRPISLSVRHTKRIALRHYETFT
jgi:hypothetical protein